MVIEIDNLISKPVIYYDFMGFMRYGRIIYIEPYPHDEEIVYLYIEDENQDENIHDLMTPNGVKYYADIRLSTDVVLDINRS